MCFAANLGVLWSRKFSVMVDRPMCQVDQLAEVVGGVVGGMPQVVEVALHPPWWMCFFDRFTSAKLVIFVKSKKPKKTQ